MTYIYTKVNESAFHDAFRDYGRNDQFTYEGRKALFEYLDSLAEDIGEPIELDVIALCCDYTEATLDEVKAAYDDIKSFDDLEESTTVIKVDDDRVIYQAF